MFFPAGTAATMLMPDGSSRPVSNLTFRVTEFTVGTNGPAAMPAALPPTSAYTYCAAFSSDEELSAGATAVQFSQPVPLYVDNFLGVPVGTLVPVGYYDRAQGVWLPSGNGIVMAVRGSTNGSALIDLHGTGQAETPDTLAANGFTAEELQTLAALYPAGKTLWRSRVPHNGSPIDFNFGRSGPVPNKPNQPGGKPKGLPNDNSPNPYGTLNFSAQTFTEQIPLVGVPFALNYNSARVPDYRVDDQIIVSVSWQPPPDPCANLPSGTACAVPPHYFYPPIGIYAETDIAGGQSVQVYPGTNQMVTEKVSVNDYVLFRWRSGQGVIRSGRCGLQAAHPAPGRKGRGQPIAWAGSSVGINMLRFVWSPLLRAPPGSRARGTAALAASSVQLSSGAQHPLGRDGCRGRKLDCTSPPSPS